MTKVKICGITNIDDAMAAVEAGADALGFVFAESSRHVDMDTVSSILRELPPFINTVGVFANQSMDEILTALDFGIHYVQIHGEPSTPSRGLARHMIRGIRVGCAEDIHLLSSDDSISSCTALLLDAHVEGMMGGTGRTFDWDLAVQAKSLGKPIILAGGLTPDNVEEAVRKVQPYAVDVSTGVEISPGRKDHAKIKEFITNAKR